MVTRPRGEQLRFESANTGSHILDDYLEAAEIGGRTLSDLLSDLFDLGGDFRGDIFEFRIHPSTNALEVRVGDWPDSSSGWVSTGDYIFRQRGAFANATAYKRFDFVTHAGSLYVCTADHTSSASSPGANFTIVIDDALLDAAISSASSSASAAASSASAAAGSASDAAASETAAAGSATAAAGSASDANDAATDAAASAASADVSASDADAAAGAAATSASAASGSASAASGSASAASTSASAASSSAGSAASSASDASDSAADAASSASNAAASEAGVAADASAAATSAANAATSATNAASSASFAGAADLSASNSASAALSSKNAAASSASAASTSASNASTSASNAATSATNAATSESNAAATLAAAVRFDITQSKNWAEQTTAMKNIGFIQPGAGFLTIASGALSLQRFKGRHVCDGSGNILELPSSPVTMSAASVAAAGVTPGNSGYVYAYDSDGDGIIDTLDAQLMSTAPSLTGGIYHKAGAPARLLVGGVYVESGPSLVNDIYRSGVVSFFNQPPRVLECTVTPGSTSGGSWYSLSGYCAWVTLGLTLGGGQAYFTGHGYGYTSLVNDGSGYFGIGFNGSSPGMNNGDRGIIQTSSWQFLNAGRAVQFNAGRHYISAFISQSNSSNTTNVSGAGIKGIVT